MLTLSQTNFELESVELKYANNSNTIVIQNPKNQKINSVKMYNISGQLIYNNQSSNNGSLIRHQVRNINTGIYIISLETENNGLLTKKIIAK